MDLQRHGRHGGRNKPLDGFGKYICYVENITEASRP